MSAAAQPTVIGTVIHELGDFELESGEILPEARIAYRSWGRLSATADNVVVVCHALTGSPDVDAWWPGLLGSGRSLDPDRDFIICCNVLGSCYGSTGPASPAPHGHGNWGGDFPAVTVRPISSARSAGFSTVSESAASGWSWEDRWEGCRPWSGPSRIRGSNRPR